MASKSKFVGVRLEPAQQRKLIVLSLETDEPGNLSAALRWLVDNQPVVIDKTQNGVGGHNRQELTTDAVL